MQNNVLGCAGQAKGLQLNRRRRGRIDGSPHGQQNADRTPCALRCMISPKLVCAVRWTPYWRRRQCAASPIRLAICTGHRPLYDKAYGPLARAVPDLERRDYIVMAGPTEHGDDWVGAGGYYTGTFTHPWLDIPPTGHQMHMRFHEFFPHSGREKSARFRRSGTFRRS